MTVTTRAPSTRAVSGLAVSLDAGDGTDTILLRGQADVDTVPVLADMLARVLVLHDTSVVVDLRDTELVDAAAAQVLGNAAEFLNDRGRRLTLRSPLARLVPVLERHGLSHTIERAGSSRS
jgi:anti-anti-sigma regulatory factor